MTSIKNSKIAYTLALAFAVVLSVSVVPTLAFAQADDGGCCDTGWYDTGSGYSVDTGWYDTGSGYGADTGWYDTGYGYAYEPYTYDTYDTVGYYNSGYGGSYYTGGYGGGSYGTSYRSTPTTFYAPGYAPRTTSQPVQQQQQQQQQQSGGPINIVNNNVNTNTNTNVAPVSQATPQHTVQYIYQQQSYPAYYPVYTYPTYNYPTYYTQLPSCTITATTGVSGLVTLYWSSSYATSAYISPSVGSVAPNGSTSLYNYGNTVYTMTVTGSGGSNTCRTNYINTYVPPVQTPSVSLTQIPYTGYDFGPVGNAMYWVSMFAFAAAGAYLLVYFLPRLMADKAGRGGAFALVGSTLGSFRKSETVTVKAAPVATAQVAAPAVAPKAVATFENLPTMPSSSTKDLMSISRTANGAPRIMVTRS